MTSGLGSKILGGAWVGVLLLAGLFAGCDGKSATTSDSETHFLEKCSDTCAGGLTCLCGVCTKPCTAQSSCGALSADASCEDSCTDASTKVCDVACSADGDCSALGPEFACSAGRCRQGSSSSVGGSANGGGGSGGSDSSAGAGGVGAPSACNAKPDLAPSFRAPTELDPDLVARAAAVIGSCMPDDGVARNATHIWLEHLAAARLYFRFGEQLACIANAACGCAALEQCFGWVASVAPPDCTGACSGDVFTGCGDGAQQVFDCGRLGLSCDPQANCVAETAVACDGSELPTCTAAGEVQFCDDGFLRKTPCQALGFACDAGQCVGKGASCTATLPFEYELVQPVGTGCSGSTLQACLGGKATTVDCATQGPGFGCQTLDGSFFCGLAAECVPADNYLSAQPQTCDGTVLSFCNAGRLEHLDCTALGFTGCEVDSKIGHYGCTPGLELE